MGDPLERMRVYYQRRLLPKLREGPSRFEFALGSAGECEDWYDTGEPVPGTNRIKPRIEVLQEIQRMLKAIIPRERVRLIRPKDPPPDAV